MNTNVQIQIAITAQRLCERLFLFGLTRHEAYTGPNSSSLKPVFHRSQHAKATTRLFTPPPTVTVQSTFRSLCIHWVREVHCMYSQAGNGMPLLAVTLVFFLAGVRSSSTFSPLHVRDMAAESFMTSPPVTEAEEPLLSTADTSIYFLGHFSTQFEKSKELSYSELAGVCCSQIY